MKPKCKNCKEKATDSFHGFYFCNKGKCIKAVLEKIKAYEAGGYRY